MYSNIFYFSHINKIGGTEQFLYEIAKKYNQYDITVFYDEADQDQLTRIKKLVKCKKRIKGEKVKCKKAFFNYTIGMIDDIDAEEYYFVSHANYQVLGCMPPITHPKITHFIGVSDFASNQLDKIGEALKVETNTKTCYDPLTIEPVKKPIIIVSACRLDDSLKGGARTLKLIEALDKYCLEHKTNYLWFIFTNKPTNIEISSPNVALMQPRTDILPYISMASYLAQLSDDMETFCYSINQALSYSVPIITTPLSVIKELPITSNEQIVLDWDCSNADEVAKQIFTKKVKPFKYAAPADSWNELLDHKKSDYKSYLKKPVKVQCVRNYYDLELNKLITIEDKPFIVTRERADYLIEIRELCREVK